MHKNWQVILLAACGSLMSCDASNASIGEQFKCTAIIQTVLRSFSASDREFLSLVSHDLRDDESTARYDIRGISEKYIQAEKLYVKNHPLDADETKELTKAEKAGAELGGKLIKEGDHIAVVNIVKQCEITYKEFSKQ